MTRLQIPSRTSPLTASDRIRIAKVLSRDLCRTVHPEEVEAICMEVDILWVKLTVGAVPIHKETFKAIDEAQQSDDVVKYVMAQEAKLEADQKQAEEIEVDCADGVYRVWRGATFIGSFYQCSQTRNWTTEPMYAPSRRCTTPQLAQNAIIKAYKIRFQNVA